MIYFIVLFCLAIAILLILFIIRKIGEDKFEALVESLSIKVAMALREFDELFQPTRMVDDVEIESFKDKYASLFEQFHHLKDNKYYKEEIIKEVGLERFNNLDSYSQSRKEENHKVFSAIEVLKTNAKPLMKSYRLCVSPSHYFTHSELDELMELYQEIEEQVDIVFPKYAQYVSD